MNRYERNRTRIGPKDRDIPDHELASFRAHIQARRAEILGIDAEPGAEEALVADLK
jgi:hypothetical protein